MGTENESQQSIAVIFANTVKKIICIVFLQVFENYYGNPKATAAMFDAWLLHI